MLEFKLFMIFSALLITESPAVHFHISLAICKTYTITHTDTLVSFVVIIPFSFFFNNCGVQLVCPFLTPKLLTNTS